jgi:DNA-directed RNA polymerase subunit RPC12/RpoP
MGILDNLEAYLESEDSYKVPCSKCGKIFIMSTDTPFTCLLCSQ